jgi:hypothetical protein
MGAWRGGHAGAVEAVDRGSEGRGQRHTWSIASRSSGSRGSDPSKAEAKAEENCCSRRGKSAAPSSAPTASRSAASSACDAAAALGVVPKLLARTDGAGGSFIASACSSLAIDSSAASAMSSSAPVFASADSSTRVIASSSASEAASVLSAVEVADGRSSKAAVMSKTLIRRGSSVRCLRTRGHEP